jgi:hypothetical protein
MASRVNELGPVVPHIFPPAPGWSPGGTGSRRRWLYSRGPERTAVYGGLRVAGGLAVAMCAPSRSSAQYQRFLQQVEDANPDGQIVIITDNLSSHDSMTTRPGWKAIPASGTPSSSGAPAR